MSQPAEQIEITKLDIVRGSLTQEVIHELELTYRRKVDLSNAFSDACDHQAQKAGIHSSVLKAWIKARVEDKEAEHKSKAEQLQMLFDELDPDDEP